MPTDYYTVVIMTQKVEECTICLEYIKEEDSIGIIQPCRHYYHDHCVLQWSSNSNTCPTCRKLFYKIEVRRKDNSDRILRSIEIKDKILANDAINDIPQEFIIPNDFEETSTQGSNHGICMICSSSDYRYASREMLLCGGCNVQFHSNCLGLSGNDEEQTWFCPICDYQQEAIGITNNSNDFLRCENTTLRCFRNRAPRVTKNVRTTKDKNTTNLYTKRKTGLIIHNENDELDDDFLYDNDKYHTKPIINGGVLLRKELEIKEKLTEEEANSWDLFEQAKSGGIPSSVTLKKDSSAPIRRRRKKLSPVENCTSQLTENKKADSRISGLIKQILTNNEIKSEGENALDKLSSTKKKLVPVTTSLSLSLSINEPGSSIHHSETQKYVLNLDQKIKIQKHVRNKLRPYYNILKKDANVKPEVIITNEESYISINKNISRKIYNYISKLGIDGDLMAIKNIEDIFNEENTLKEIVEKFVTEELKKPII